MIKEKTNPLKKKTNKQKQTKPHTQKNLNQNQVVREDEHSYLIATNPYVYTGTFNFTYRYM